MKGKKENKLQSSVKKKPPKKQQAIKPDNWKCYTALGLIILISIIAYLPVFHNNLLDWDDQGYIKNNLLVHSFNVKGIFSQYVMGNYHPFTMLTFAAEYHLFGLNAAGYHAVNLLLHLINVILVFYVVFLLSEKVAVALVAALLFGIHPLHVESVAWAAELKDLLYALFFLASYIFYLKYLKELEKNYELRITNYESIHPHIHTSAHQHISTSTHYYLLALLLFLVSLLSKAMAASLPLVLILTDYFKGRKINKKTLLEKAPFFVLAFIFGIVAVFAQKSTGSIATTLVPFPDRIVFASYGFINYLYKLLFPLDLCAYYPYPVKNGEVYIPNHYYLYLLAFLVLAIYIIYSRRFSKNIIFGIGFFTLTILMVLQLLPVGKAIMADRYGYIPSIGIFYLAGEAIILLWNKRQKSAVIALVCVSTVLFSAKTYARCGVWKNEKIFWNDVIAHYQTIEEAYYNRGIICMHEKKDADAINDFDKAIELKPDYSNAYNNKGLTLMNLGKLEESLQCYNQAIEFDPKNAEAFYNRGSLYQNQRKNKEALADFDKAIELNPRYSQAYNNRGSVFYNENRGEEALKDFHKAVELDPVNVQAYYNLGVLFMNESRNSEAVKSFNKAIELNPGYANAYNNRGIVFVNEKRNSEAINDFTKVIELQPINANAYNNRGIIYMNEKRNTEAINDFNYAIELNPGYTGAYSNKANLLFEEKRYKEAAVLYTKVIELMNNFAPAWYKRGLAEYYSGNKSAACNDLNKAAALGYKPASDALSQICK
jgi:protein O-mannosyl-transferase